MKATLDACKSGISARCGYECSTEFGCSKRIPKNINATCAAAIARDGHIEWIADTGSAQDLISKDDLGGLRSYTANGPSAADVQADVKVPSLGSTSTPYVLPSTPSVLTVGYRCMEEGFDFVWRAYQRPFIRDSKGNKTYMDVRDYVPYLKSWKEVTAVPARRKPEPPVPASPEQDDSPEDNGKGTEVENEKNAEIIHNKMDEEPLGSEVCCISSDSAAEADAVVIATPATLPDESMSLHDLMTSDPDPPAPKAKPKPKPKAKAKADAKPKAKPKPKS